MARGDLAGRHAQAPGRTLVLQADRLAALVHPSAALFNVGREGQREVEWMDVKGLRVVDRLVIARAGEQGAHARALPRLEAGAELFGQRPRALGEACTLVGARDGELA
jgi:hypothetical protein